MPTRVDLGPPIPLRGQPEHVIAVYRGWDAFERAHGGPEIIDFDLTTITNSASFHSRRQILDALQDLLHRLDGRSDEEEFLRDRVLGSIDYLRALMGQQFPFHEYLRRTLGITPERFSDSEVDAVRNEVDELLQPFGLEMKEEHRARFQATLLIRDPDAIRQGIVGAQDLWLARLRAAGIPVPEDLRLEVDFDSVDAYWSNWIRGSVRDGFKLTINVHPRKQYDLGRPAALCLHEICGHAVHMSIWRELIAQGKLNPACGLTIVHGPEAFVSEGLGETVGDLLGAEAVFPVELRLSRRLHYYTLMILHNAHLMLHAGSPVDAVLEYAQRRLPFAESSMLEAEVRDRGTNPLFKAYQLSYAAAQRMIRTLIHDLTPNQKRQFFIEMYTRPLTPLQLQELASRVDGRGSAPPR